MVIWKYVLPLDGLVDMPEGGIPLSVETQGHEPCLWAEVNPDNPLQQRRFCIVGTGNEVPPEHGRFIGTCLLHAGAFVLHVFDES